MTISLQTSAYQIILACGIFYLISNAINIFVSDAFTNKILHIILIIVCLIIAFFLGLFIRV